MESETKTCQNCKKDFTIEPEDFDFYEKMKVPSPTWCPECRMIRRFFFMNVWNLYKRNCAKCEKDTLSVYSKDKPNIVYCNHCWWGDSWDGREYGMDYDPKRSFFEQLHELFLRTPWQALDSAYSTNINSEYTNATAYQKNCYMVFWADYCENVYYSSILNGLKHSVDCLRSHSSELCYESIGIYKCYRTFFSEECDNCVDVWFSRNCYGCTDCIGCVNLRGASNCIFNVKYTREEYEKKIKELNLDSSKNLQKLKVRAYEFWLTKPYREYRGNALNLNVTGEYVFVSKNSKNMYMCGGAENCKWCQFITVKPAKDCWDYSGWGNNAEKIYETSVAGEGASNLKFTHQCWPDVLDIEYSIYANACKHVFGCINLKHKQYCILNKEYSKEEYEKLKAQIVEDMIKNPYKDKKGRIWTYGEFLPLIFSTFAYNETIVHRFFPKTKEEALKEGFEWYEKEQKKYEFTKKSEELPDTVEEIEESILNEIITCSSCDGAYRFTAGEIDLMKKLRIPLPRQCFTCRQNFRFSRINGPKLHHRTCAKCNANIYTPYAPDRPEIVYCVKCYQGEFL